MKTISIIGTVGVPACYGGFESLVENLLDYTPINIEYTVYCSSKSYTNKIPSYKKAFLKYVDLSANGITSIPYDIISMWKARKSDIVLILGVSGCLFLPFFRFIYKGKIITNIDGLEWKRNKWNKLAKWLLHTSEKSAVKYSDVIIGDNKGITDYVKDYYKKDAILIEYGSDHAEIISNEFLSKEYPFSKKPYGITVCRIEPENNIHEILKAFSESEISIPLVVVGNWQKSEYGKTLFDQYSQCSNIILLNPIYESEKINFLRSNAELYIHGHSAGGTNPSLVEAMNLKLPIIAYDCIYNRETTESKALYWNNYNKLKKLVSSINENTKKRIANDMKEIAIRRYSWKVIAEKYHNLY